MYVCGGEKTREKKEKKRRINEKKKKLKKERKYNCGGQLSRRYC